jgi:alginate O-acetyltransferase complex protein AlgI
LWHGANWTFVVWGGLHGIFLVLHHAWVGLCGRWLAPVSSGLWQRCLNALSVLLTFWVVVLAWVFFRADSMASALRIVWGCLGLNGLSVAASDGWLTQSVMALFRAADLPVLTEGAFELASTMHDFHPGTVGRLLLICLLWVWFAPSSQSIAAKWSVAAAPWVMTLRGCWVAFLLLVSLSHIDRISTFIYYQF